MKRVSPVEKFPGHVILPEFLTLPQVRAFESAISSQRNIESSGDDNVWVSVISEMRLPAIFACISEWHLQGIPEKPDLENFPMTPIVPANELVTWLFTEVRNLWVGETEDPK